MPTAPRTLDASLFGADHPRLLLVASTGGHLTQLVRLAARVSAAEDSLWVTFDSPQSRSLLAGKRVLWVDYVAPRDLAGTLRAYRAIARAANPTDFDGALSSGAAVGLAGLSWAARHRIPRVYVESVSRTHGPSLTGRIIRGLRVAKTFTQHEQWATPAWPAIPSVLGDFVRAEGADPAHPDAPLNILVTLGTIRPYRFDTLIDQVVSVLRPEDTVTWQLGESRRTDLAGTTHDLLPAEELLAAARGADVVITHAGVGTVLQLLENGVSPVVVPRRRVRGEHVDDHQLQITSLLGTLDLAHPVEVEQLDRSTLASAARSRTRVAA
ncbi:polysaccharide biosynthesis protein CpsF [Leucobacter sp. 7(1)]|uniref:glycosyltransferase n=1 Tax=Leucobacter sp. 7(1) TaxID=1255613 RepID=UPI00097F6531|nr:glycosyltransferase [Leucobacter sp. 7(1)]SJN11877.1 polysaccharide biosynthesis protein CpsF [Leucobacter sp. 7(1)]